MAQNLRRYRTLFLLIVGVTAIFMGRTLAANRYWVPRLSELFESITILGAIVIIIRGHGTLHKSDWFISFALGVLVPVGMCFATLYTPYPVFGTVKSNTGHALIRGICTFVASLGGLAVMRQGGPIQFTITNHDWRLSTNHIILGLLIGLPLAIVNVFALQLSSGQPVSWQNPLAAMLDAFQPAILEEVVYRFALIGLFWLMLRQPLPDQAVWLSGGFAMIIHNFMHFDDLLIQAPLVALGMGAVMALLWGLPLTLLAVRKGLESAIAFHWVQDVFRFVAGF